MSLVEKWGARLELRERLMREYQETMDGFGTEMREARLAKGLALREVAKRLNLSAGYIHDIELNRRIPSAETALRMVTLLEEAANRKE